MKIFATAFPVSLDEWQMDGKANSAGTEKSGAEKGIVSSVLLYLGVALRNTWASMESNACCFH